MIKRLYSRQLMNPPLLFSTSGSGPGLTFACVMTLKSYAALAALVMLMAAVMFPVIVTVPRCRYLNSPLHLCHFFRRNQWLHEQLTFLLGCLLLTHSCILDTGPRNWNRLACQQTNSRHDTRLVHRICGGLTWITRFLPLPLILAPLH